MFIERLTVQAPTENVEEPVRLFDNSTGRVYSTPLARVRYDISDVEKNKPNLGVDFQPRRGLPEMLLSPAIGK